MLRNMIISSAPADSTGWHSAACSSLSGLSLHDPKGVVVAATAIAAGSNFTGITENSGYNAVQIDLPSLCRVEYNVQTSLNSSAVAEIWLPLPSAWNRRFLAVDNGGFAGGVNYPDVVWGARKGFAAMSTNTGHNGSSSDGTPFQNPEHLIDWGYRALHLTSVAAKSIVKAYYGNAAKYSYYAGCSTGGRQGLNAAQRYPSDYDGIRCLTGPQITNLKRMYAPWLAEDGRLINPGISPSGEASFSILMNGLTPTFGLPFYAETVFNNTNWDWRTQSVADVDLADSINPGGCNAYDPDMRPFHERGGKVLQYHGCADPLIPSLDTPALYDLVDEFFESVGKPAEVEDFYRLFMVPGMGHCAGGPGAWALDGVSQVD
ncbi:tannase-domain-containing protein [Mytilinidion resinicola]|uniref:Carboxylic ester hydrolase n=1 Tax=Mytilinidion resinicola TaxID=574789 RepID=A0A6A6Y5U4_9PEZI|nr:tannase-domain-containing protein [Mytilinidion resinicola]KAF2804162.1 tannase-domain-containing protein [Mytilinidion resinicola]